MNRKNLITTIVILCALTFLFSVGLYVMSNRSPITTTVPVTSEPTEVSDEITVEVFYSQIPESFDTDFSFATPVSRIILKSSPVETSLLQLINGPTVEEISKDLRNPISLTGESNCSGANFRIVSNSSQLGLDVEVHFCKDVMLTGVGDSARIQAVITKTLLALKDSANFTVGRIAVLDKNDNCLGDESGANACLK